MIILDYDKKKHKQIIHACVLALQGGKTVVYPTDTSYGLACDMTNQKAVGELYRVKGRDFNKLTHVVAPSVDYAKTMGQWSRTAVRLAKKFWPGPLTIIIPLNNKAGTIGIRYPDNPIAHDLAYNLGRPIAATGANPAGQKDSYSLKDILDNFKAVKHKPDIIINAGRLPKRKPSTLVRVIGDHMEILRRGPITEKQIQQTLK